MDLPKLTAAKACPANASPCPARNRLGRCPVAGANWPIARKGRRPLTAIVTADATDAQRLIDELAFFAPDAALRAVPDWETLPYDTFSPHQDLISERLATLWRIQQRDKDTGADVVLVPATTALYRLAPPAFLAGYTFHFKVKQKLDEAKLKAQLTLAGYSHVTQVVSPGEYAVRGGLIDLFPMGSPVPYRVDLFDDEIDSIRTFDPDSQRSLYPVPEVRLLPGREFPMDDAARAASAAAGASCWKATPPRAASTRTWATAWPPPASSTTCRCSSTTPPPCSTTWAPTPRWCCTATWSRLPALLAGHPRALPPGAGRPRAPGAAARGLFLGAEQFYTRANAHAQLAMRPAVEDVADSANFVEKRCPT
jgi:transcription-repair coupling factor (superfamily II helicase)